MRSLLKEEHLSIPELVDYMEGRLTEDRRRTIEEHLSWCEKCLFWARKVMAKRVILLARPATRQRRYALPLA